MTLKNKNFSFYLKVEKHIYVFIDKTIIGHTLKSDFDAMEFNIEDYQTRDLMKVDFLKLEEGSSNVINYMRV